LYVQGVSTRKVAASTEELCGLDVSSSQVSRASKMLDEELDAWHNRPLDEFPWLILDARCPPLTVERRAPPESTPRPVGQFIAAAL
jgi:transposase-like protein